jgi:hypothetical protein
MNLSERWLMKQADDKRNNAENQIKQKNCTVS